MTELREGVNPPVEDKVEKEDKKDKLNIRFALFFDGTLNNRTNVSERKAGSEVYEKVKKSWFQKFRGYGSYENEISNVAKMEPYIESTAMDYDHSYSSYIEGQGTINKSTDDFLGKAVGEGESGIISRAKKGILEIQWKLLEEIDSGKYTIEKITIDVFGFSRGAATARHFINWALDESSQVGLKLPTRLKNAGFDVLETEVNFVGLYDTVASFGPPFAHKHNAKALKLDAIKNAKSVVQLAASEEHRVNFSLSNIDSALSNKKEVFLPGVHSDIGGGYVDGALESQIVSIQKKSHLEKEMESLELCGWYTNSQMEINCPRPSPRSGVSINSVKCKLEVTRMVKAEYDRIPLQIMAVFARDQGINLKPTLEFENDVIDSSLHPIKAKLKSYAKAGKSVPEDWHHNEEWLRELRNKHLHFSAHFSSTGMEPRYINEKRKRLYYDG